MQAKDVYSLEELFEFLPISISELARQSRINEVTIARIRDGKPTRRHTANKLLNTMSSVYTLPLNVRNVTGIHIQGQEERETAVA